MVLEVSEEENRLVQVVREQKTEFCCIHLRVYVQHNKLIRVELDRVVESKALSLVNN